MDSDYFRSHTMSWGTLGTVRPFSNFWADRDAAEIQSALERKDAVNLVRVLTNRSNAQRQLIADAFREMAQKDLEAGVKKAVSGELASLLLELLMPPLEYEARRLQQAMVGLGTDEETLMEILSTRSGQQLQDISAAYKFTYKKDLEKELKAETSGDFAKLVVALLNKQSVAGSVQTDTESLAASVNGKKAEAGPWIAVLTSRDQDHLKRVLMGLEVQCGQKVDQVLEKNFSGDIRLGLKILAQCSRNPYVYLAKRLTSTKASIVHGVMVSHCEEDLLCIRAAYLKLTGTSLYTALQKQYKGEHLQALLAVCRSED